MSKRTKFLLGIGVIAALVIGWQIAAFGLGDSNFEIDPSANLKDDPGNTLTDDWNTVDQVVGKDKPPGQTDDSYQGGAKEDDTCPGTTTGSIPKNKSDLLEFGAYTEPGATPTDPGFLNLYWTRVQDPSGTTLMDFELNQSGANCGNGVNLTRTVGDLLIEYRIEQGGQSATIKVREWTGSAWGPATDLTGTTAVGTINQTAIPAGESELGALSAKTFGEMQLDLDFIFDPGTCESFGSAFVKSRASDSFTSQLKDFIAPKPVNITNCGTVIIRKETTPDGNTTDFNYTKDFSTDPATPNTFTLNDGESETFNGVLLANDKTVVETIPANWTLDSIDCSAGNVDPDSTNLDNGTVQFDIDSASDVLDCTYHNSLNQGALRILKDSTKGGAVTTAGAAFDYTGTSAADVIDNGTGDLDNDIGQVCVAGLAPGSVTVTETAPPSGYALPSTVSQSTTVVTGTNCGDNLPTTSGLLTFVDPPLADIQVNFRDGGSGETDVTSINCQPQGGSNMTPSSTTAPPGWDDSATFEDLVINPSPRTFNCTVVIDP